MKSFDTLYENLFNATVLGFEDWAQANNIAGVKEALPLIKDEIREEQKKMLEEFVQVNGMFKNPEEEDKDEDYLSDLTIDLLADAVWVALAIRGIVK